MITPYEVLALFLASQETIGNAQSPHELLTLFLASREEICTAKSLQTYHYTLTPFIEALGDTPISADSIRAYLAAQRERQLAEESVRNIFRQVKTMCRWLVDEDLLLCDPFIGKRRVQLPPRTRQYRVVYSDIDVIKMLVASKPQSAKKRLSERTRQQWRPDGPMNREELQGRGLVVLLLDSALRASEACSLTCGDLRADVALVTGKGGHRLPFFMSDPTRAVLAQLTTDRPDAAPLFRNWDGHACQARDLRTLLMRLAKRAGVTVPPRPLHAFRHYAARQWKGAGLSDLVIMDLMRHTTIETTRIYTGAPDVPNLTRQHAAASPVARLLVQAGLV